MSFKLFSAHFCLLSVCPSLEKDFLPFQFPVIQYFPMILLLVQDLAGEGKQSSVDVK